VSAALPLLLVVGSVALLVAAMAAIRTVGQRRGWSAEVQRKCVHVLIGLFAMALPVLFAERWMVVALVLLALVAMILLRLSKGLLGRAGAAIHSVERRSFGDIWLAVTVGFLFLHSEGSYVLYGLPLAIVTLSDAAAALTGSAYGRRRFAAHEGVKSWEGVIAFAMVGWIAAMSMLLLFSEVPRGNVILLGFVIATFGAMVEAVSWRGLDNLFVPLVIHFFLFGYMDSDLAMLALLAAMVCAASSAAPFLARRLRLEPHVARAYVVALFVLLGVGELDGAIFPVAAMACYLAGRGVLRDPSPRPDLDFLGTLCGTALVWYFTGETAGRTAIHFYNAAMASFALGYAVLALAAAGRSWAVPFATLAFFAALLALAESGLVYTAAPPHGLALIGAASLALVTAATFFAPRLFRVWRAPRLAALASVVPLAGYARYLWIP
jgi:dolichol kinase